MQLKNHSNLVRLSAAVVAALSLAALTGCGVSADRPPTNYSAPIEMTGLVLAGRNYVANAQVTVYETQPNGVASNGHYVGTAKQLGSASTSVTGTWTIDGISCASPDQLYVVATGGIPYPYLNNFTTLTNNPNSLMVTAVGDCGILTNEDNPRNETQVLTNEASSVAAVWALRPFMSISGTTVNITSDATNYGGTSGAGVIGNYAGLAHAFLNATNMTPFRLGAFQPFTNGANSIATGGLVDVQELNALAYLQYLCTMGAPDGATAGNFDLCVGNATAGIAGLYPLTTQPGGTAPTNSLQAMLNIANNPAYNAQALMTYAQTSIPGTQSTAFPTGYPQENYGLTGQLPAAKDGIGPYIPALTSFCATLGSCGNNDWTVAMFYGPGIGGNGTTIQPSTVPMYVSVDVNDNVYFSNPNASTSTQGNIISLNSNGAYRWGSLTDATVNIQPRGNAADQFGNVWVAGGGTSAGQNVVQEFDAGSGTLKKTITSTGTLLYGIAVDSIGNIWYTDNVAAGQNLHEIAYPSYTEVTSFPIPPASGRQMLQVRPDSQNNIWVAGYLSGSGSFQYLPNTGTAAAPAYASAFKQLLLPAQGGYGIAVDASGNAYMTTNGAAASAPGTLYKATVTGTGAAANLTDAVVASIPAFTGASFSSRFMDTDGNGALWFGDNATGTFLYSYVPPTGSATTGTVTSFLPCFASLSYNGAGSPGPGTNYCGQSGTLATPSGISTRFDMALDSTGSLWVASYGNASGGRMVQIISPAAPTVPLKALGKMGVMP